MSGFRNFGRNVTSVRRSPRNVYRNVKSLKFEGEKYILTYLYAVCFKISQFPFFIAYDLEMRMIQDAFGLPEQRMTVSQQNAQCTNLHKTRRNVGSYRLWISKYITTSYMIYFRPYVSEHMTAKKYQ